MGDYLPPAEPVTAERCDVDVSVDADELAYDRGLDLDVCLDVDLSDGADVNADADLDVTDTTGRDDGAGDGVLEVL